MIKVHKMISGIEKIYWELQFCQPPNTKSRKWSIEWKGGKFKTDNGNTFLHNT